MSNTLKLAGYCRVSTDNQKDEGTIELQENALKEFALTNGFELTRIFKDEGISGGLEERPGLVELFSFLEANESIDAVVIYRLDRLARDLYIQEHLIKKLELLGKKLISTKEKDLASDDPMRKAFRQFMGIVAELEKAFITMRLSGGRINKARKGKYAGGGVAIGYEVKDKDLQRDEKEMEIVRKIFVMRLVKELGIREIARRLTALQIPSPRGGLWHPSSVKYILDNPIYRGELVYKTERVNRQELALIQ